MALVPVFRLRDQLGGVEDLVVGDMDPGLPDGPVEVSGGHVPVRVDRRFERLAKSGGGEADVVGGHSHGHTLSRRGKDPSLRWPGQPEARIFAVGVVGSVDDDRQCSTPDRQADHGQGAHQEQGRHQERVLRALDEDVLRVLDR